MVQLLVALVLPVQLALLWLVAVVPEQQGLLAVQMQLMLSLIHI